MPSLAPIAILVHMVAWRRAEKLQHQLPVHTPNKGIFPLPIFVCSLLRSHVKVSSSCGRAATTTLPVIRLFTYGGENGEQRADADVDVLLIVVDESER
jgi:hypothetical protein